MSDKVNLEENSKYRVAYDLMIQIATVEKWEKDQRKYDLTPEEGREYFMKLYRQCYRIVYSGDTFEEATKEKGGKSNPPYSFS